MKKIILCGGGTLGHFTPNIAIYEKLKDKYNFTYIGSKNGMEKEIAKKIMNYKEVETAKLVRSFTLKNLLIPFKLIKGIIEAKKILKEEKASLIFSKGGYASIPIIIAGKSLKIPCITHESDLSLGLANKIISKKCKYVCTSFKKTAKEIKNGIYTGTPIRKQLLKGNKYYLTNKLSLDKNKKNILVIGGSLGSTKINKILRENLQNLSNYNILHITGKNKKDTNIKANNYYQIEYASDIENYYACADLVITRGGSNTLFELLTLKKAMLIIPLSLEISRGDQIENAKEFKKNGCANILYEEELNNENFINAINDTIKNSYNLVSNMETNYINGTKNICTLIEKTIINNSKK